MQRRQQAPDLKMNAPPPVEYRQPLLGLPADLIGITQAFESCQHARVLVQQHMRADIDIDAHGRVSPASRSPARDVTAFQDQNRHPRIGQPGGAGEPGNACATIMASTRGADVSDGFWGKGIGPC